MTSDHANPSDPEPFAHEATPELVFKPIRPLVNDALDHLDQMLAHPRQLLGVSTGYSKLNDLSKGLQRGQMVVIAGRISSGKTSLAMNIAEHVGIDSGKRCAAFFSEMPAYELALRMLASRACLPQSGIHRGLLTMKEKERLSVASRELQRASFFLIEPTDFDIVELADQVRKIRIHGDLRLLVIDGANYLTYDALRRCPNGRQPVRLAEISAQLKALALEMKLTVLVTAHLDPDEHSYSGQQLDLCDLGEALPLAQEADVVGFLTRIDVMGGRMPIGCKWLEQATKGKALLTLAKNRNGPLGEVPLHFLEDCMRFVDPEGFNLNREEENL